MGRIIPLRECVGYLDPLSGQRWKAGSKWAAKSARYSGEQRGVYTTNEPPHQCERCATFVADSLVDFTRDGRNTRWQRLSKALSTLEGTEDE